MSSQSPAACQRDRCVLESASMKSDDLCPLKPRCWLAAAGWLAAVSHATAQSPTLLPEMVVLAERRTTDGAAVLAEWDRANLQQAAPRTLDELLAREPSFSLFRRQTALFGNPSSAGVSLRNTGATAASRTLVLLDGVPQNDPFGGWVYWARYDAAALESVRIVPSAQTAVWGNQSPAGVVQMSSRPPLENVHAFRAGGGSHGSIAGSTVQQWTDAERGKSVWFSGFGLHSDGFYSVAPAQRGPIDRPLDIDLWGADVKFAWQPAPGLTLEPKISWYAEERGNGTPLARNSTDALDLSLRATGGEAECSWQVIGWHQRREFESVFTAVDETRTTETVALNQYDVPGRGTGGAVTAQWNDGGQWSFMAGIDTRWLDGETNEDAGTFRKRVAGGEQSLTGVFAAAEYRPDDRTRLNASTRLDGWRQWDGRRIETSLEDGSLLRADFPGDHDGLEPSGSLEITRQLHDDLEGRISAGSSFRLPTLNELYRPFRVRNDITEANPDLDAERFISLEAGLAWQANDELTVSATLCHHWIKDAVANVPVTDPAEIAEIFGTLPDGGSGAIKRNVDESRVAGIEGTITWQPAAEWSLELTGLWSNTEFTESAQQPLLVGKPFPQAPELRVIATAEWRPTEPLTVFAGVEHGAEQFDDALATRRLPPYTSVRVGLSWRACNALYQLRVDNLFDEEIQTGLSSDGLRSYAAPRSLWAGVEWEF